MPEIIIRDEISSRDIQHIVSRHRILYEDEFGFNSDFSDYVEKTLEDPAHIWIAEIDRAFAGCIGVVEVFPKVARLRWLLIEPNARGMGLGKALIQQLLDHCKEKKYQTIFLWTVNKLPAARKVYEHLGFQLTESKPEALLWGQSLSEQRWDLSL
jgi:GNAT superfamily N-acetyltransferase